MKAIILSLMLLAGVSFVHAEETVGEKASATGHDMKRSMKKGVNNVKEAVCTEGDAKCLAKKAGHKMNEGGDYVKDKAVEGKNKVDSK